MGIKDKVLQTAGELTERAVKNTALNVITDLDHKAYINGEEKREKVKDKQLKKAAKKNKNTTQLFLETDRNNRRYLIYDLDNNLKYQAKNAIVSAKKHIYLMDQDGKRVGSVKEKTLEILETAYIVEIGGKEVGRIKRSKFGLALKYLFEPGGYIVTGEFPFNQVRVVDGKEVIVDVVHHGVREDYYIITITRPEMEVLAVLTLLAFKGEKIKQYEWRERSLFEK